LNFAGQIQQTPTKGAITFVKDGFQTLNLTSDNNYSGQTIIGGGTLILIDAGRISGTSALSINNSTLSINNSGLKYDADRVPDAAPITLNSGGISYTGRSEVASTETV